MIAVRERELRRRHEHIRVLTAERRERIGGRKDPSV
jgi:hypothetical protein